MNLAQGAALRFWNSVSAVKRGVACDALSSIINEHAEALVSTFYGTFLQHKEGSSFLTHSVVHERLSHSLRNWLLALIEWDGTDIDSFEQRQVEIGAIHARIKIPISLVLEGASLLKTEIARLLVRLDLGEEEKLTAIVLLDEIIDYAMRLMSASYIAGTSERAHIDEAFRLFSLGQDISIERETQRAALMEWCQKILFGIVTESGSASAEPLSTSPFGLWVRHRANILFHGASMLKSIEQIIERIDRKVVPAICDAAKPPSSPALSELQANVEEIKFLLSDLFQAATDLESGRDPLTRALNRKFLASVLTREITLAKKYDLPLSIIMIDVDHFKSINDEFGHTAGDVVLRQVADMILEAVRNSDFVFRYGGEEFLIVLVETLSDQALMLAERLRGAFANRPVMLPDQTSVKVTISAGVASYEGHPDYQFLINAADRALYRAKNAGRNRVLAV
ncbi:GGDEF domain-containing protein [Chelativorans sp. Marseille-P2723]|uniref:GGDEF domain-containing protein n=1 Tax=Chelativorans sp. Marseille-P2723 TaxID=2709133 RepID=UPI00156D5B42|nr:GGDEF domain-containing protein [Chelativorans sp. Marseille-P2723]